MPALAGAAEINREDPKLIVEAGDKSRPPPRVRAGAGNEHQRHPGGRPRDAVRNLHTVDLEPAPTPRLPGGRGHVPTRRACSDHNLQRIKLFTQESPRSEP
jgi:hypothetical protein